MVTLDISVVIPTLEAATTLSATLETLAGVREVIVVDGGSSDATRDVALYHGTRFVETRKGRGLQLATGADLARGEWLLFLHADTRPDPEWLTAAAAFIADPGSRERAATFDFRLDDNSPAARRLERMVAWRGRR
jgi:glycosyltransferase involved in cell wall biosynthesis